MLQRAQSFQTRLRSHNVEQFKTKILAKSKRVGMVERSQKRERDSDMITESGDKFASHASPCKRMKLTAGGQSKVIAVPSAS